MTVHTRLLAHSTEMNKIKIQNAFTVGDSNNITIIMISNIYIPTYIYKKQRHWNDRSIIHTPYNIYNNDDDNTTYVSGCGERQW